MTATRSPSIEAVDEPHGIKLTDPIEGAQFTLLTPRSVEPTPVDPESFVPPVDTAASVPVGQIRTPYKVEALVRNADMDIVADCSANERTSVDPGEYYVEVSSAKMKLYLHVSGGVTFTPDGDQVTFSFQDTATVRVGVRSLHEHPAGTVQTSTDPEAIAAALSYLGSGLKTTSCERSFPTLRGHPPLIETDDELSVPDNITTPNTGITIQVPGKYEYLFAITPLAYYLGATVEIRDEPLLIAEDEQIPLDQEEGFETTVERILKQVFLFDCVTRTEGLYDVSLHERDLVEEKVSLDFQALYDESIGTQVKHYLAIPYSDVAEAVPTWKLTADVTPEVDSIPTLPFLAHELAVIRCPDDASINSSAPSLSAEVKSVFQNDRTRIWRSASETSRGDESSFRDDVFTPAPADSIEQTYVGEGIPLGASKMASEQYYRRLDFEAESEGRIRVLVVCNDSAMSDENAVSDIYGTREWLDFDISVHEELTTGEFTEILQQDADFIHYIGHADDEGIRCSDGHLDARTLDSVNVNAFLLNACQSYEQGRALVQAGAVGGIATLSDVLNRTATEIGRSAARFLNQGFSLLSMQDLLKKRNKLAQRYLVLGDGNTTLVESRTGTPYSAKIEPVADDKYDLTTFGYPSKRYPIGSINRPHLESVDTFFLNSGKIGTFSVSGNSLTEYLEAGVFPVVVDDELFWSNELSTDMI